MSYDATQAPDSILALIVEDLDVATERGGVSLVITVGGSTLSGQAIPNWQWAEELSEQLTEAYRRANEDARAPGHDVRARSSSCASAE